MREIYVETSLQYTCVTWWLQMQSNVYLVELFRVWAKNQIDKIITYSGIVVTGGRMDRFEEVTVIAPHWASHWSR